MMLLFLILDYLYYNNNSLTNKVYPLRRFSTAAQQHYFVMCQNLECLSIISKLIQIPLWEDESQSTNESISRIEWIDTLECMDRKFYGKKSKVRHRIISKIYLEFK